MTRSCGSILLAMCVLGAMPSCDEPAMPIQPAAVAVGELGPVFKVALKSLDGEDVTLEEFNGKPILIEVWATWCGPCRTARKRLAEHHDALTDVATLVGVSVDQGGAPAVKSFLAKNPMEGMHEYMVTDAFRSLIAPYDRANTIPKFIYVSPDGNIIDIAYGVPNPEFTIALLKNLALMKDPLE